MSFHTYLNNIKAKTGKSPDDFREIAEQKGLMKEGVRATEIIAWLKDDFNLGHGHSMAIITVFKNSGWIQSSKRNRLPNGNKKRNGHP